MDSLDRINNSQHFDDGIHAEKYADFPPWELDTSL